MTAMETESAPMRVDISPDKNGGITKTIIKHGQGEDSPSNGCTVHVHYIGRLENGEKFDSSRDRGDPFEFKLGEGNVIKGWDVGVATMLLHETCELKIAAEYAYGEKGFPPKIPGGATLIFEVELLSWEDEDITEDGGVLKRVLAEGVKGGKPNLEGSVKIQVRGTFEDRVFDEREVEFVVGDGYQHNIVDGIEKGVVTMRRNERSKFFISSQYGFKQAGSEAFGIHGNAETIVYEILLLDFQCVKEIYEMSYPEKVEKAHQLKEHGLKCIKAGLYEKAIEYYDRMLVFVKINKQDSDYGLGLPHKIAANSNAALCFLKLGEFAKAKLRAERVIKYDGENVKGHFRLGESCLGMKDYKRAVFAYENVLRYEPENSAAKRQLATARIMMKKEIEQQKQLYSSIFSKMADED